MLVQAAKDWVSLHDLAWLALENEAHLDVDLATNKSARRQVVDVATVLYRDGLMVPGDLTATGFEDWSGDFSAWLRRTVTELERLRWSPMGDGHWLRSTPLGDEVAQRGRR